MQLERQWHEKHDNPDEFKGPREEDRGLSKAERTDFRQDAGEEHRSNERSWARPRWMKPNTKEAKRREREKEKLRKRRRQAKEQGGAEELLSLSSSGPRAAAPPHVAGRQSFKPAVEKFLHLGNDF